jgi:glucose-6-phosphate 1-dehydrogenase
MAALILFGGGGDLAMRMLLPSLYFLEHDGLLPEGLKIIGAARSEESADDYIAKVHEAVKARAEADKVWDEASWSRMKARLDYLAVDATSPESLKPLKDKVGDGEVTSFLAVSPSLYARIVTAMKAAGLAEKNCRIVLEKPVGRDLKSFLEIDDAVAHAFSENQVFRIDHYLGKETVQNLIALRFGNTIFEPLWNNLSIDHVQITIGETVGVGDRWPYYDEYGALRDMLQNHMLQLLCLVAMEPPSDLDPDSVRNEKVKVLRSLRPYHGDEAERVTVRGQYVAGVSEGKPAKGYDEERGQPSDTETFVAVRADIDNWRWAACPSSCGPASACPTAHRDRRPVQAAAAHSIFDRRRPTASFSANRLVIELQPEEDISLTVMNKRPGLSDQGMRLQPIKLSAVVGCRSARVRRPPPHRLREVVRGCVGAATRTLFVRRDEVEQAWKWVDDAVSSRLGRRRSSPTPYVGRHLGARQSADRA